MTLQFHYWASIWKNENTNLKRYMYNKVHSSTIYNPQDMEATQSYHELTE